MWATPSSSLSVTGTRILSSMVYVSGSGRLAGKLYLLHCYLDRPKELPKSLILRGPRSTQEVRLPRSSSSSKYGKTPM
jgi:hypothetical protein